MGDDTAQSSFRSSSIAVLKDFTAGFVSGALSTYVGYPLDTVKVRMQVSHLNTSIAQSMLNICRTEGFKGLFKGALSPVIGYAPVNATLFTSNEFCKRMTKDWRMSEDSKILFSGMFGGFVSCAVVGPSEFLKVKKQAYEGNDRFYYSLI